MIGYLFIIKRIALYWHDFFNFLFQLAARFFLTILLVSKPNVTDISRAKIITSADSFFISSIFSLSDFVSSTDKLTHWKSSRGSAASMLIDLARSEGRSLSQRLSFRCFLTNLSNSFTPEEYQNYLLLTTRWLISNPFRFLEFLGL